MKRFFILTVTLSALSLSGSARGADLPSSGNATPELDRWWQRMFSIAFDGHGNLVAPHLATLHPTAASLGAGGYDETAPNNTLRQRLDPDHVSYSQGSLTLRVPAFTHYQVLRLSNTKP